MEKVIKKVLNLIEKNGFEAYLVGGYVRDTILKRNTYDIDVCTNALPKNVKKIFNGGEVTKYGNFFMKIKKYDFEITTYRKEYNYLNRKPRKIDYINNLIEDIERRDFTINAICMNVKGDIIDLVNGVSDINNKIIKTIGDPYVKLDEDPLRILRAIRFATILNFKIDDELSKAINEKKLKIKSLSTYRIKAEFDKILINNNAIVGINLLKKYGILDILEIRVNQIKKVDDLIGIYAQMDIGIELPFTKEDRNNIIKLKEIINSVTFDELVLYKYGLYLSMVAGQILGVDKFKINKMYKSLPIHSSKDIKVEMNEIVTLTNLEGKKLGEFIEELIYNILTKKVKNTKKGIYSYIKRLKEK